MSKAPTTETEVHIYIEIEPYNNIPILIVIHSPSFFSIALSGAWTSSHFLGNSVKKLELKCHRVNVVALQIAGFQIKLRY